jgi:hypothetical protein
MKYDSGKMNNTQNISEFAKEEQKRLDVEKSKRLEEKGYEEFYHIPEGQTEISFLNQLPRVNSTYPDRQIFRISVSDKSYDLSVNVNSPLYRDIIRHLSQGQSNLKVLRLGTGKDTRYKVEVKE